MTAELIIDAINRVKMDRGENIKNIFILSPNHNNPQNGMVVTTLEIGGYKIADDKIEPLVKSSLAANNPELIQNEHGLMVPMKYLAQIYKNSSFIPITISPYISRGDVDKLTNWIVENKTDDDLVVISVDFAHKLMTGEAMENNEESIRTISDFDFYLLSQYGDEHMDSPKAMEIFLKVMQRHKATEFEVWKNIHGSLILNQPLLQGTSYITGGYR